MKKAIYSLALASALVATPVSAVEGGLKVRVENMRAEVKEDVEMRHASSSSSMHWGEATSTASSTNSRQGKHLMFKASVVKRIAEHTGKVMQATIERLEKLTDRVASRIAKVKAEGGVTTDSESALADAKVHISAAKTELVTFASISFSSEKLSDNVATLREAAAKVKTELRAAHASLVKAVEALKPGKTEVKVHATSTTSTTSAH